MDAQIQSVFFPEKGIHLFEILFSTQPGQALHVSSRAKSPGRCTGKKNKPALAISLRHLQKGIDIVKHRFAQTVDRLRAI